MKSYQNKFLYFLFAAFLIFTGLTVTRFFLGQNSLSKSEEYLDQLASAYNPNLKATIDQPILKNTDPFWGLSKAKNTIVLFSDFQCPYCASASEVLSDLINKYGDKLFIVWKDLPNRLHPEALSASLAARCAQKQNKFWQYHDKLFSSQGSLGQALYRQIAQEIGLDEQVWQACYDNQEPSGLIQESYNLGLSLAIDATPYMFVNGQRISGLITLEELEKYLK